MYISKKVVTHMTHSVIFAQGGPGYLDIKGCD